MITEMMLVGHFVPGPKYSENWVFVMKYIFFANEALKHKICVTAKTFGHDWPEKKTASCVVCTVSVDFESHVLCPRLV